MFKKVEIIYPFNGYADPEIKNVEISRVNGYKTVTTKEHRLKNINPVDAKRIIECADQENIDIESIIEFIKNIKIRKEVINVSNNDEKRFSKEEKIVEEYIEKHPGTSYRKAVLICLDKTESHLEREKFTERELREKNEEEREENLEKYNKEQAKQVKRIDEYIEKHPGISYRDAVLAVPALTPEEEKSQEMVRMYTLVGDIMQNLATVVKSEVVKAEDRTKLNQASDIVGEVVKSLREMLDKED